MIEIRKRFPGANHFLVCTTDEIFAPPPKWAIKNQYVVRSEAEKATLEAYAMIYSLEFDVVVGPHEIPLDYTGGGGESKCIVFLWVVEIKELT
jgi:hypothetical protein